MHDALAEHPVGEVGDGCGKLRVRVLVRDNFQQPHVARRVEEMRDEEVAREGIAQPLCQLMQRDGRCVGGDRGTGPPHRVDFPVERLLDVEAFDDGFDDPIAVRDLGQVVFDVAGSHELRRSRGHERRRLGLQHLRDGVLGKPIAIARARGNDVEQEDRNAGVGELRGDAGAHDAGTDDGRFMNGLLHDDSPL